MTVRTVLAVLLAFALLHTSGDRRAGAGALHAGADRRFDHHAAALGVQRARVHQSSLISSAALTRPSRISKRCFTTTRRRPRTKAAAPGCAPIRSILKEIVWAGFDLVSRANNHAGDFGVQGAQITTRYVREAGLVQAGVGDSLPKRAKRNFSKHRRPAVALISAASTFTAHSRAGNTRGDMPARPGLSPLRFTTTYTVTPERLADLRRVASELSGNPPATGNTLNFGGRRYVAGPKPGTHTEPNKQDVEEIARVVKSASALADIVIVSLHCHEQGAESVPADFIPIFARAMIDAGAERVRRPWPARAARHRDLQRQADLLQPVEFHFPERDRAANAGRQLRRILTQR